MIGSDFEPRQWRHVARFDNARMSRIEMHLEARDDARPCAGPARERRFAAGERIHTENSYKYTVERFAALLERGRLRGADALDRSERLVRGVLGAGRLRPVSDRRVPSIAYAPWRDPRRIAA